MAKTIMKVFLVGFAGLFIYLFGFVRAPLWICLLISAGIPAVSIGCTWWVTAVYLMAESSTHGGE